MGPTIYPNRFQTFHKSSKLTVEDVRTPLASFSKDLRAAVPLHEDILCTALQICYRQPKFLELCKSVFRYRWNLCVFKIGVGRKRHKTTRHLFTQCKTDNAVKVISKNIDFIIIVLCNQLETFLVRVAVSWQKNKDL